MDTGSTHQKNIPTILVILGATGDLMARKIAPALFHLYKKGKLPERTKIVGCGRRPLSDETFRDRIRELLVKRPDVADGERALSPFLELVNYHQGLLEEQVHYDALSKKLKAIDDAWGICTNKLFYLAVPPEHYEVIFQHLQASGLSESCAPEIGMPLSGPAPLEAGHDIASGPPPRLQQDGSLAGWTRILVEKPFGKDLATAEALDELLAKFFKEEQIYRIDHYLAKEMAQNILNFRFANNLFEHAWSNRFVEKIEIRLHETLGAETRGAFYDSIGALRDVGQNHFLQLVALTTMDRPLALEAAAVHQARREILNLLRVPSHEEIERFTYRAQYRGYRDIEGVYPQSNTETYFKIRAFLDSPRWRGVPILLEGGKKLGEVRKEVTVTFRHPTPCLCPSALLRHGSGQALGTSPNTPAEHLKNRVRFEIEPVESIAVEFWTKKPGLESGMEKRALHFSLRGEGKKSQYIEEYERLLLDCIAGDQMLFLSTDEVRATWRFIDPVIRAWHAGETPLHTYAPNTAEPIADSRFIDESLGHSAKSNAAKKEIGYVGIGKMGKNMILRLLERGWAVHAFNRSPDALAEVVAAGAHGKENLAELARALPKPRLVWLMVSAGKAVDDFLFGESGLAAILEPGDIVIDGGNSFFEDSVKRAGKLAEHGIHFLDAGVSGGPHGARHGATIMVGGERETFDALEHLFHDLALPNGYRHVGASGAGHFVKMVHNGIEYGMMQSLAEGFALMRESPFALNLSDVADLYNHGSVIESRLVGWLRKAFDQCGERLEEVSGSVAHTGEGEWTVKTAEKLGVPAPIIKGSFEFRVQSKEKPSYIGKILSALRNQFGGHKISEKG